MNETTKTTEGAAPDRSSAEAWVERTATFWGRALVDAWRTVFPPREDYR